MNRIPSTAPSISFSPTSSSPPTVSSPPSLRPTSSSAPTPGFDCSCGVGHFRFELDFRTDNRPQETSWVIQNENGDILLSENGYGVNYQAWKTFHYDYCLPVGCYDFVIDDSSGDGICCLSDVVDDQYFPTAFLDYYGVEGIDDMDGYFKGSINGWKEVFDGGEFGFRAIENFCGDSYLCTNSPSESPSVSLIPTSSSAPTFYDCSCEAGHFKFELEVTTDIYPEETSWKIQNDNADILVSESGYNEQFTTFNHEYCLPVGCHDQHIILPLLLPLLLVLPFHPSHQ